MSAINSPPEISSQSLGRERPLNTLLLGGCMVHWPLRRPPDVSRRFSFDQYGTVGEVHSFGEIFQLLDVLQGNKDIPQELRPYAHMRPRFRRAAGTADFHELDLVLLGPSSPVELVFRGVAMNRTATMRQVLASVEDETGQAEKFLNRWSRVGLVSLNEAVRAQAAARLLEYMPGNSENAELARSVVRETRAFKGDLRGGFLRTRAMFRCPLGLILYVFRYMPDGRPISWPAGFYEDLVSTGRDLGIPMFDPSPLVMRYGVEKALLEGHNHYKNEFLPTVGEEIAQFAESIAGRR
jgi:hypothetical protein